MAHQPRFKSSFTRLQVYHGQPYTAQNPTSCQATRDKPILLDHPEAKETLPPLLNGMGRRDPRRHFSLRRV